MKEGMYQLLVDINLSTGTTYTITSILNNLFCTFCFILFGYLDLDDVEPDVNDVHFTSDTLVDLAGGDSEDPNFSDTLTVSDISSPINERDTLLPTSPDTNERRLSMEGIQPPANPCRSFVN